MMINLNKAQHTVRGRIPLIRRCKCERNPTAIYHTRNQNVRGHQRTEHRRKRNFLRTDVAEYGKRRHKQIETDKYV